MIHGLSLHRDTGYRNIVLHIPREMYNKLLVKSREEGFEKIEDYIVAKIIEALGEIEPHRLELSDIEKIEKKLCWCSTI